MPQPEEVKQVQTLIGATADGAFGPHSVDALLRWLRDRGFLREVIDPRMASTARAGIVRIAMSYIGEQSPDTFYQDAAPQFVGSAPNAVAWCGVFALHCYRRAAITGRTWVTGKGFAYGYLPVTNLPEMGDLVYWGPSKRDHYAIVTGVEDGWVHTIDGNAIPAPKEGVALRSHRTGEPRNFGGCYFSIGKLVGDG